MKKFILVTYLLATSSAFGMQQQGQSQSGTNYFGWAKVVTGCAITGFMAWKARGFWIWGTDAYNAPERVRETHTNVKDIRADQIKQNETLAKLANVAKKTNATVKKNNSALTGIYAQLEKNRKEEKEQAEAIYKALDNDAKVRQAEIMDRFDSTNELIRQTAAETAEITVKRVIAYHEQNKLAHTPGSPSQEK